MVDAMVSLSFGCLRRSILCSCNSLDLDMDAATAGARTSKCNKPKSTRHSRIPVVHHFRLRDRPKCREILLQIWRMRVPSEPTNKKLAGEFLLRSRARSIVVLLPGTVISEIRSTSWESPKGRIGTCCIPQIQFSQWPPFPT